MMGLESTEKTVTEDTGVGLKRELRSLLTRYPAELARTRDQIQRRADLAKATHLKIDAVQQAIAALEPLVRAQHGQIEGEVRLMQGAMIGLILLIALLIDTLQRKLARVLTNLAPALSTWAEGDFGRDIQLGKTNRELHDIEASLNRLRAYLVDLVGTIRQNAEQVADSSRTLADLSSALHGGAERQAGDTGQIRDALGELEATIQQVSGDASQAADASRSAGLAVEQGQKVIGMSLTGLHALVSEVQGNAKMIEHLAQESATIGGVLTVIRSIADQTNLLALRTGPGGRRCAGRNRRRDPDHRRHRRAHRRRHGPTEWRGQRNPRSQRAYPPAGRRQSAAYRRRSQPGRTAAGTGYAVEYGGTGVPRLIGRTAARCGSE